MNSQNKKTKFSEIYNNLVTRHGDTIYELQKQAQKELSKKPSIKAYQIIILLIGGMLYFFAGPVYGLMIFSLFALFEYAKYSNNPHKKNTDYANEFKTIIISDMVKQMDKSLTYYPTANISLNTYREANFERTKRIFSEDLIKGNLKGTLPFQMAEVNTQIKKVDDPTYTIIFEGLFAKIELSKSINNELYIKSISQGLPYISSLTPNEISNMQIQLDSQEFEQIFNIFTKDKIITMQLLTSDIMQMLLDFYKESNILFEITIKNNYLYIRFKCKNMFEPTIFSKSPLDKNVLYRYYNVLNFTFELSNKLIEIINAIL